MKKTLTLLATAFVFTLSGCGNTNDATDSTSSTDNKYPLTIKNVTKVEGGTEWTEKDQVFDKAPERVLANTRPAAELLLHLGLKDKIAGVGAVFGMDDPDVKAEFDELNHLSDGYINKETALSVDPDLIFGRGGLFDNAAMELSTPLMKWVFQLMYKKHLLKMLPSNLFTMTLIT
jgi:iron complex transport system substrate-binding protein